MTNDTVFHCPRCGAPVDESGNDVLPIPDGYKPENCESGLVCWHCQNEMADEEYDDALLWYLSMKECENGY